MWINMHVCEFRAHVHVLFNVLRTSYLLWDVLGCFSFLSFVQTLWVLLFFYIPLPNLHICDIYCYIYMPNICNIYATYMWHSCGIYVTRMLDVGIWDLWAVIWCIYVTCMLTYMLHKCVSYVKYMLNICDIYMTYLSHTAVCACMHIYIYIYIYMQIIFDPILSFFSILCIYNTSMHANSNSRSFTIFHAYKCMRTFCIRS